MAGARKHEVEELFARGDLWRDRRVHTLSGLEIDRLRVCRRRRGGGVPGAWSGAAAPAGGGRRLADGPDRTQLRRQARARGREPVVRRGHPGRQRANVQRDLALHVAAGIVVVGQRREPVAVADELEPA